jgi:hypothetical protein
MKLKELRELVNAIPIDKDDVPVVIGFESDTGFSVKSDVTTVALTANGDELIIADKFF